jgi:threonine/homoserine/homoserine lactone efflux protein
MLNEAIGQVLAFAVVVAISPIPIVGVVLMLGTPRARANGPAFLAGWVAGLSVVGVVVLLVAKGAGADAEGGTSGGVSWLKIVLGLLLIGLAVRQWRARPRGDRPGELPGWMQAVDDFTATRAAAMGVGLSAVNPKNLLMTVGACVAIVQTGATTADAVVALAVFVLIATLGVGIPLVLFLVAGERAARTLDAMKGWLAAHNNAVMAVLLLVIGAKLLGDGISIA